MCDDKVFCGSPIGGFYPILANDVSHKSELGQLQLQEGVSSLIELESDPFFGSCWRLGQLLEI